MLPILHMRNLKFRAMKSSYSHPVGGKNHTPVQVFRCLSDVTAKHYVKIYFNT